MERIKTLPHDSWHPSFQSKEHIELIHAFESGQVLFFPKLIFPLQSQEEQVFSSKWVNEKSKNISFNPLTNKVRGLDSSVSNEQYHLFHAYLARYAQAAQKFITCLFPDYSQALKIGRTSFRPVEIKGRVSSYRKDDTRLHVDAFPSNPNHGWRILRVFSNVNPQGEARVWRLGEPFESVAKQFLPKFRKPFPGSALFLEWLRITKKRRTLYDHFMLQLHDNMKANEVYQRNAQQEEFHFPSQSTWVVQTDQVSHAAMSGQYLLEQTFYLPVQAMLDEQRSPLRILEKLLQKKLI